MVQWEDYLDQVLSTKPAEVVQEACQMLEKHDFSVTKELKSELYYSNTLCQVCSKYCISSEWSSDLLTYSHPAALNELFTSHLLTAEECSEVASKGRRWEGQLNKVLLTKPAEVVQEASQVLEKHGYSVKKLKSELYYSSTLCQVVFQVQHYVI